ncbi:hypothetical protein [Citromicrobium sp. JLT1363]|jgi:hypothetical protein|uniref:hypothetical protein n=1 Tax=Citromicrobium sp. JLT1363 TaxID=517722 RepID=UPI00178C3887|nr:hypothetical protein [Citromicrobium sp. JLT1363]|tara:strand:- start:270 stop:428 length:159 start_codon:yes stop_codon:yes gene_type:complete
MSEHSPADRPVDQKAERLAAQLRENLRRRKAQARAHKDGRGQLDLPKEEPGS